MALHFSKMHGAGNDFVVLDLRHGRPAPDARLARALGDRHTGVGFDQLLTIEDTTAAGCVARYRIWNQDGSAAQQCGNGARCVAAWLLRDGAAQPPVFRLDSPAGVVEVECLADGGFELQLGVPDFRPARIPLKAVYEQAEYAANIAGATLRFGAVSMGNPHAVVVVDDLAATPVAPLATALQASGLFPDGVNVGFAQVLDRNHIRLRVFERGTGETLACGSGACAALAVLVRQGRSDRAARIELPGGMLDIAWLVDDAPVRMAGPAAFVFEGEWLP
jgi:diaminopimelate epimerase